MGPLYKYSLIIKCLFDQAKRSITQDKSGFAALVDCVVASAASWFYCTFIVYVTWGILCESLCAGCVPPTGNLTLTNQEIDRDRIDSFNSNHMATLQGLIA